MAKRTSDLRCGPNGGVKINHRPPRCKSHKEKVAGRWMLRQFGGDVALAKKSTWLT